MAEAPKLAMSTEAHTTTSNPIPAPKKKAPGLTFKRAFTKAGVSPYDEVEWELRTAAITDAQGNKIFEQLDVETPKDWSMTATNIVASKYLHGTLGTSERESGVRALIARVAETITRWGIEGGYFRTSDDAAIFHDELVHLLVQQKMAFNSPVWFNVGCDRIEPQADGANWHWNFLKQQAEFGPVGYTRPQCSACFINSVHDSLDSILTLAKTEGMLFKWGSGTGTNLSPLRSSNEQLSGGGTASGPLSFMRGFDAFAGVIKSGGKTRRAAKMVILNIEHPDIVEFIDCKAKEEAKAWALMQQGYDGSSPDAEAYSSIFFQNANNSVRVTDDFMYAVVRDADFSTKAVKSGDVVKTFKARWLLSKISEATWQCGDPGMQYDTTVNRWHTSKNTARINASNPCSEYMFLDDSACNLASLNLMKFAPNGTFDVAAYRHACAITITAQEILVDNAGYPTESIMKNSHDYRPLGLGYANLGALLMAAGLPYDSDAGRDYAACVTAIMCGEAYLQSSKIAELGQPLTPATPITQSVEITGSACPGWYVNREPFLDVIRMHRASVNNINQKNVPAPVFEAAKATWDEALQHGERHGYRNSQVTVLAPTGTIGFMMDCDTTGIEPDLALVKYKKLVGGGMIKIVNNTVPAALFKLGYTSDQANATVSYIDATGTIEGAPHIKDEHLAVFDCSFKPAKGTRTISYMGHVKMMAATQPFISGAISKTVNLPKDATIDDIMEAYIQSWKLGLKAVAIYRDGSKGGQPLNASGTSTTDKLKKAEAAPVASESEDDAAAPPRAIRHRLPDERLSVTHKFNIGGHEGYITVGLYKDGMPGEVFITMAKEGSTVSGLMDSFACATSLALQHGVPLKLLCEKFAHTRFEPSGWSHNPDIGFAKSIMDYIFRWLQLRFLTGQQQALFEGLRPKYMMGTPSSSDASSSSVILSEGAPAPESKDPYRYTPPGGPVAHHVHTADALKDLIDLGDAPSCHVCGAIMTRNGSCYRCNECGSTSGCS
ncbi:Ribonucleoside-diphosphate reductase [Candidatus Koribacter versatilis Ellin345]|uniref:Vitamin B12-dependent ribonucleotide reductase n=1 Tax=Koribacter versatilis (strain Ellin345) TaxID=204669 RepID=Q1ISM3_KORVE|nr:vitamin B12-dependent ribonucleotide reductase [Candidatus Koribacter versatilis]ABF40127.1 Ribonucleoside-diphosphate reductase [Candidatus Koribacter versatilis Ellin345]